MTKTGQLRDLSVRYQQLLRLVELSVTLNSTLDLDQLLQQITATATELLDCEAASILLYDEKNPRLYFAAATGSDPAKLAEIPVPMEGSLAGTIFRTNQPIILNNAEQDPRHRGPLGPDDPGTDAARVWPVHAVEPADRQPRGHTGRGGVKWQTRGSSSLRTSAGCC